MFDRHKKSICFKRRSYQYYLGDCVYGCKFFFYQNGILLDIKNTDCLLIFLCYVMQFIN